MNNSCQLFLEFFKLLIPAAFIISGWVIVHKLTTKRDIEKSRRDIIAISIDKLCDQINIIVQDAQSYHLSDRDIVKENNIKRNLQDISIRSSSLKDLIDIDSCQPIWTNLKKFKQAITGQHFEDEHTEILTNQNQQFELIAEYELALKRTLFDLKHLQFKLPRNKTI
jgi:hypothetical protein